MCLCDVVECESRIELRTLKSTDMCNSYSETDAAGVALFLASPASYYITGQIISVDGGYLATNPAVV